MHTHSTVHPSIQHDPAHVTATRLQSAARMLARDPAVAAASHLDLELVSLVDECLHACRDGAFFEALDGLRDESKAYDLLRTQIDTASATTFVDTDEGPRVVRLCAVPVLLSNQNALEHGRIAPGAAFDALSASLCKAGFVHAEASIGLTDYLYHPEELQALWPSEVNRLTASLMPHVGPAALPRSRLAGRGRSGWPCDPAAGTAAPLVQLRFLLVTVSEDLGADDVLKPWSDDEHERLQVALCDWAARASSPLAAALGLSADDVVLLTFAPYAQSMRTGFESLRYVRLRSALEPLVQEKSRARDLSVTLALCNDQGDDCRDEDATAIRLLALSSVREEACPKAGRSLRHHYPTTGPADALASLARVVCVLRDAGVRRIWVVRHPEAAHPLVAEEPMAQVLPSAPSPAPETRPQPADFECLAA